MESRLMMLNALRKEFPNDSDQELRMKLELYVMWSPQNGSLLNINEYAIVTALKREHPTADDARLSEMKNVVKHKLYMHEFNKAMNRKQQQGALPNLGGFSVYGVPNYPGPSNPLSEKDAVAKMQEHRNLLMSAMLQNQTRMNNPSNGSVGIPGPSD